MSANGILAKEDTRASVFRAAAVVFLLLLMVRHMTWRITDTLPIGEALDVGTVWQWVFFCAECLLFVAIALQIFWHCRLGKPDRSRQATEAAARMARYPRVAVLIPTYNEDPEILERTIVGAIHMRYPDFETFVLDDGRRAEVASLAKDLGVRYLARGNNDHAKAGNLNNALDHLAEIGDEAEFVAILDADFVPGRMFLARTIPLFDDETIGVVQTPQHFFNADLFQTNLAGESILPDDQRPAQLVDLSIRDAWGVATSVGTSSVLRLSSLRRIGGFPTESICEDTLTSVKLWTIGERTVFLNEQLTQGLAVEGVAELLCQRGRWALGNMQILRSSWGPFSRHRMPFVGRVYLLSLMASSLFWPFFRIVFSLGPIIYLFLGIHSVQASSEEVLSYTIPIIVGFYIVFTWALAGTWIPFLTEAAQTVEAFATVRSALNGLLHPKGHRFRVTAKGIDRARAVVHWRLLLVLVAPVGLYILGIFLNLNANAVTTTYSNGIALVLAWCLLCAVILLVGCLLCVDFPRRRSEACFGIGRPAKLTLSGGEQLDCIVESLSVSGAVVTIAGRPVIPEVGGRLHLSEQLSLPLYSCKLDGNARHYEIAFAEMDVASTRRALLAYLFSGEFRNSVDGFDFASAIAQTASRLNSRLRSLAARLGKAWSPELR